MKTPIYSPSRGPLSKAEREQLEETCAREALEARARLERAVQRAGLADDLEAIAIRALPSAKVLCALLVKERS